MIPAIDDSEWPIVKITFPEVVELGDIPGFASRLNDVFVRRGPAVTIADITDLSLTKTTALHRKRIAEEADKFVARGLLLAEAVVIRNPAVRLLFQGYSWVRARKTHPLRAFDDGIAAREWAQRILRADSISKAR